MFRYNVMLNMFSLQRKLINKACQLGVRSINTGGILRKNLYEVLGLTRDATQADIKNAYFQLSKVYHPDRIAATDENLAKFREITDAYEILGNEHSRKLYDRGLVGDSIRGKDESTEIVDPIVKFYKERHDMKKAKSAEELDAWAEAYYKEAKKRAAAKSHFYTVSEKAYVGHDPTRHLFSMVVTTIALLLFLTNFKNNKANDLWNTLFGSNTKMQQ